ncbi:MAG: AAA domain-containing protein [Bacteroidetes bacterium]|jgi:ATP-dependent Clp protease ATP-binding subunit ClpA|nr:AAA domain-containing protein [Bacteroidota bacterium]
MAFKFQIPFYAFRLQLQPEVSFLAPLSDAAVLRVNQALHTVAGQYANALQKKVLNEGQISELLQEYNRGGFAKGEVAVQFPAARQRPDYPAFQLSFTYFYNEAEDDSAWAIIPALGIEAYAEQKADLEGQLRAAIRLDFTRKKRLQAVQGIVSAIWMSSIELEQATIDLQAPTPRELEEKVQRKKDLLLPKAANELGAKKPIAYGQEDNLKRAAQVLTGNFQRNLLLVGPSGVGKTALVQELARQKNKLGLKDRIWETTASNLIKELMQDTGWQHNIAQLCRELAGRGNILYVRSLMDLFEVGKYEGNDVSVAEYLRPFLARGELTMIAECTAEEVAQIEIQSPNYLAAFQRLALEEPPEPLAEDIVLRKVGATAQRQNVNIKAEAVREAIRLSRRFTPYDGLPGRPIRFMESLLMHQSGQHREKKGKGTIQRADVIQQFCEETGMPRFMVDPDIAMKPERVKKTFNATVFGQEEAVERMVGVLSTVKAALSRTGKPIASLLFVGPTGVGKTELAKLVARFMFGSEDRLSRFDMSEYSTPYEVQRLIGTHFYAEGLLTSTIRKAPFCVLLFDEIEKAHSSFFDLLLQVLSEGRLTDSQGQLVNFCSTIIIMTSNVGARGLQRPPIGWGEAGQQQDLKAHFTTAVQKAFRPELFNRIDQIVPFGSLDQLTIRYVVEREMELLRQREGIRYRRVHISLADTVYDYLARHGYNPKYGARQLQRTIREALIIPLAQCLNTQDPDDQVEVKVRVHQDQLEIEAESDPLAFELLLEEMSKINHTDHASNIRRELERLQEGRLYVKLLSQLDLLVREKQRLGEAFWEDKTKGDRYTFLMATREKCEALMQELRDIELGLSEACLGAAPYEPAQAEQLDQLENELFLFKLELFARLQTGYNHCQLAIYGAEAEPLMYFYQALFMRKGYEYEMTGIWYRETAPEEPPFVECPLPYGQAARPPQPGDLFWGVKFAVRGLAVRSYLQLESGIQRWHFPPQDPKYYWVMVSEREADTPANIHRRDFYTKRPPRRVVSPNKLKDTVLKLEREYNKGQLPELIAEQLDRIFKTKLDRNVL